MLTLTTVQSASGESGAADDEWNHAVQLERLNRTQSDEYRSAIERYDTHLAGNVDARAAVEKCRFIEALAYGEDAPSIDSAVEDLDRCQTALAAPPYVDEPLARVYLFEQLWGEGSLAAGTDLISSAGTWPPELRSRLHARMSWLYLFEEDEARSGMHAIRAAELDASSGMLVQAASRLEQLGAKSRARALLANAPPESWNAASVPEGAALLVRLGDAGTALRLLNAQGSPTDFAGLISLATALTASGELAAARDAYASALPHYQEWQGPSGLRAYFEFERHHGSREQAIGAYDRLRAYGFEGDPFARHRIGLLLEHPTAPWTSGDALGLLTLASAIGLFALLPGLIIAPVHYRSLARRVRNAMPAPTGLPWGLAHAWYVLAVVLVSGVVAAYVFAYPDFEDIFGLAPVNATLSHDVALGRSLLGGAVLMLVLVAPMLRGVRLPPLFEGQWPLRRSLSTATVLLIGFRLLSLLWSGLSQSSGPAALGSATTRAMQGVYAEYGISVLLLVAVVLVPIVEEIVFRGVLLNGLARHVSFWSAAIIQAIVFAALHEDLARLPLFALMGLTTAWLYRRSQGLVAPIAFHALNNFLACAGIVSLTEVPDSTPSSG